jgi:hypothetical protein
MLPSQLLQTGAAYSRRHLSIKFKIGLFALQGTVVRAGTYPSIWFFAEAAEPGRPVPIPVADTSGRPELADPAAHGVELLLFVRDVGGTFRYVGPVTVLSRDAEFIYLGGPEAGAR